MSHPLRIIALIVAIWLALFGAWCYALYRVGRGTLRALRHRRPAEIENAFYRGFTRRYLGLDR